MVRIELTYFACGIDVNLGGAESRLIGRIMAPEDVHILIPRTYEYVSLYAKEN